MTCLYLYVIYPQSESRSGSKTKLVILSLDGQQRKIGSNPGSGSMSDGVIVTGRVSKNSHCDIGGRPVGHHHLPDVGVEREVEVSNLSLPSRGLFRLRLEDPLDPHVAPDVGIGTEQSHFVRNKRGGK